MDPLYETERRFWLEGADFYRAHLADGFLMLFPGVGILEREAAVQGIEEGERWSEVSIADPRVLELGADRRLLCYAARARRGEEAEYAALVSSLYVRQDGRWKLLFHQQSPVS